MGVAADRRRHRSGPRRFRHGFKPGLEIGDDHAFVGAEQELAMLDLCVGLPRGRFHPRL